MVLRNATKLETWKSRLNFKKNICDQKAPDGEVGGPKSLHIQDLRIHGSNIGQIRFSLWSFSFWPRSDFHQKRLKSEKVILFFIWREEEICPDFSIFG